ncbi:MAG: rRNA maturation RNase YbeY [bacterium]
MIVFNSLNDFVLENENRISVWLSEIVENEGFRIGDVNYIFCNDDYLLDINQKYLNHDTYTDVIGFDYTSGKTLSGDIYISTERVAENAQTYNQVVDDEMRRVIIHGLLHFMGYKDKTDTEAAIMKSREDKALSAFK